ncbi:hypothetical protein [Brevundimonas diminuta]|nr:hypothetical protein [Brevundimonas diminuta]
MTDAEYARIAEIVHGVLVRTLHPSVLRPSPEPPPQPANDSDPEPPLHAA